MIGLIERFPYEEALTMAKLDFKPEIVELIHSVLCDALGPQLAGKIIMDGIAREIQLHIANRTGRK